MNRKAPARLVQTGPDSTLSAQLQAVRARVQSTALAPRPTQELHWHLRRLCSLTYRCAQLPPGQDEHSLAGSRQLRLHTHPLYVLSTCCPLPIAIGPMGTAVGL